MKKIEGLFWYPVRPVRPTRPSHQTRRFAARCVDAELDPGGSGKELVGKGSGTVSVQLDQGLILQKQFL